MVASKTHFLLSVAAATAFMLGGCNNSSKSAATPPQPAGQVIAKVGTEDLTIHELQNEYRHRGVSQDKLTDEITKSTLEDIVKRKSLAQRAQAAGLDREPTVLLDIIRGKEQILAGALLQRDVQAKIGAIGKADVDRYMNANPAAFQQRARFDVDQISVNVSSLTPELTDAVKDATSLDAIEAKLTEAKVPYSRGIGAIYTGDVPPELVDRLRKRKDSDVFFVRSGSGASTFFKVKSETPDPLTGDAATQRANAGLRDQTARAEIAGKTTDVQVTYYGTYEKLMAKAADAGEQSPTPAPAAPK